MEHFLAVAEEKGITDAEIGVIQGIVMAVSGGRVRAQFREVFGRYMRKNKGKK